jgi:hypothetical protein
MTHSSRRDMARIANSTCASRYVRCLQGPREIREVRKREDRLPSRSGCADDGGNEYFSRRPRADRAGAESKASGPIGSDATTADDFVAQVKQWRVLLLKFQRHGNWLKRPAAGVYRDDLQRREGEPLANAQSDWAFRDEPCRGWRPLADLTKIWHSEHSVARLDRRMLVQRGPCLRGCRPTGERRRKRRILEQGDHQDKHAVHGTRSARPVLGWRLRANRRPRREPDGGSRTYRAAV